MRFALVLGLALSAGACSGESSGTSNDGQPPRSAGTLGGSEVTYRKIDRAEWEATWNGRDMVRLRTDEGLTLLLLSGARPTPGVTNEAVNVEMGLLRVPSPSGDRWYCVGGGSYQFSDFLGSDALVDLSGLSALEPSGNFQLGVTFDSGSDTVSFDGSFPTIQGSVFVDRPSPDAFVFNGPQGNHYVSIFKDGDVSTQALSGGYVVTLGFLAGTLDDSLGVAYTRTAIETTSGATVALNLETLTDTLRCPGATKVEGSLHFSPPP
ncbi:hypothetical protein [Sorangium cellulosum]|uniref:hypothetical protein n=1 Tax=Sorangium cellulosum TaxID=56 RepID=UPI0005D21502|nr:hypothetical protein [Sorangium cellulosum]